MLLHILNKSPEHEAALSKCFHTLSKGDKILFIEDGVYCALTSAHTINAIAPDIDLFALEPDITARGLTPHLSPRIKVIDFDGFVMLTETCTTSVSWI